MGDLMECMYDLMTLFRSFGGYATLRGCELGCGGTKVADFLRARESFP